MTAKVISLNDRRGTADKDAAEKRRRLFQSIQKVNQLIDELHSAAKENK